MNFDDLDLASLRRRTGEKWQLYGDDVLAAWVADMDFPPAEPIRKVLASMLEVSDLGYPLSASTRQLSTLLCERAAKLWGWQFEPRSVEVLTEVVQGLFCGLQVYSEPGDGIVMQTPIYPPFIGAVAHTKRRPIYASLRAGDERYEIDFDRLNGQIDSGARILMFCNPHNPTGRVFTRAELERLAELVLKHDLIVLSDEIHAELVYPGGTHIPFATVSDEIEARTVTFLSASKAFNIAGLRTAFAVFGSPELKTSFNSIPRHIRGGLGTFGLQATRVAFEECQGWLDDVRAYLAANRDFTAEFLASRIPDLRFFPPEATYLAWLDCRALGLAPDPHRFFLEQARVGLSDGVVFGDGGEGFVRLNFATSRPILTQILERMAGAL